MQEAGVLPTELSGLTYCIVFKCSSDRLLLIEMGIMMITVVTL
jgi:hypothetical protein